MKKLVLVPNRNRETFLVPEGVEEIGVFAFYEFKNLKTIGLPKSLERIGHRAFDSCEALEEIHLYENIKEIYYRAFDNCKSLKTAKIEAENPPKFIGESSCGFDARLEKIILMVPRGSKQRYLRAKEWKKCKEIVEY